jgi:ribosomal protein S12 methylthiotransferase
VAGWFGLSETEALVRFVSGDSPESALPGVAPATTVPFAYLKISDGCDEMCTFCAIPSIKGPYYSVSASDIVAEARACLDEGARELILVGQDTAVWREGDLGLAGLVRLLLQDERVDRVRLMYLQPEHVTDELLEYMAGEPRLCSYLDVPFQHADPEVLRRMGRWGDARAYLELLEKARRLMPDVTVRSTFIVGFPGETDEQFEGLLDFVREAEFAYAGGFIYSPEEGTSAAALKPRIKASTKSKRLTRLTGLLASTAEARQRELIGSLVEVMIDSLQADDMPEGCVAVGRTAGQAPEVDGVTFIESGLPEGCRPGSIVSVRINDVIGYDLVGAHENA